MPKNNLQILAVDQIINKTFDQVKRSSKIWSTDPLSIVVATNQETIQILFDVLPALVRRRPAHPGHDPDRDVEPDGDRAGLGYHPAVGPLEGRCPSHEHRLVHTRGIRIYPHNVEGKILNFRYFFHQFFLCPFFSWSFLYVDSMQLWGSEKN